MNFVTTEAFAYPITVGRTRPIDDLVEDGRYDVVHPDITETRFPITDFAASDFVAQMVSFDCRVSSSHVVNEMKIHHLRPAKWNELLAFGASYPEEQSSHKIVALGSIATISRHRYVLYLYKYNERRGVRLISWAGKWEQSHRFLATNE